jgi:hypothetical protein
MSAASPAASASLRSDATVISLVGFAHGTSHFYHFVLPPLFPYLMAEFGLSFTQAGALMTAFVVSGVGHGWPASSSTAWARYACSSAASRCSLTTSSSPRRQLRLAGGGGGRRLGNSVFHPADFTLLKARLDLAPGARVLGAWALRQPGPAAAPVFSRARAGMELARGGCRRVRGRLLPRSRRRCPTPPAARGALPVEIARPGGLFASAPAWSDVLPLFLLSVMAFGGLQNSPRRFWSAPTASRLP